MTMTDSSARRPSFAPRNPRLAMKWTRRGPDEAAAHQRDALQLQWVAIRQTL